MEDQDVGVLDERPGDDQPLLLAAAEMAPQLTDLTLRAAGHREHFVVEVGEPGRFFDLPLGDVVAQEADVVGNGPGDQVGQLRYERDLAAHSARDSTLMSRWSANAPWSTGAA